MILCFGALKEKKVYIYYENINEYVLLDYMKILKIDINMNMKKQNSTNIYSTLRMINKC